MAAHSFSRSTSDRMRLLWDTKDKGGSGTTWIIHMPNSMTTTIDRTSARASTTVSARLRPATTSGTSSSEKAYWAITLPRSTPAAWAIEPSISPVPSIRNPASHRPVAPPKGRRGSAPCHSMTASAMTTATSEAVK